MFAEFLNCSYAGICSGCDWLLKPAKEQAALKIDHLRDTWKREGVRHTLPELISLKSPGLGQSRDRVDLTIDGRDANRPRLGLFDSTRGSIVDLQGCPQLSLQLEEWFQEFRRYRLSVTRGSLRLRVAPDGSRGVWLDFANLDVKNLLDDRHQLDEILASGAVVEIGQRRKRLVRRDGRLKLDDPVLYPWFETYVADKHIPLYATIGSFTQPGFRANRMLVNEVMSMMDSKGSRAAEFGAGIGNFTIPLSARFDSVDVYEVDRLALQGLTRTLEEQKITNVEVRAGDFQNDRGSTLDFSATDLLFVDPPRSGLLRFLDPLAKRDSKRPSQILYVSCFAESFARDSDRLFEMGYRLTKLSVVDQFPQSRHYETVALFELQ